MSNPGVLEGIRRDVRLIVTWEQFPQVLLGLGFAGAGALLGILYMGFGLQDIVTSAYWMQHPEMGDALERWVAAGAVGAAAVGAVGLLSGVWLDTEPNDAERGQATVNLWPLIVGMAIALAVLLVVSTTAASIPAGQFGGAV